MTYDEMVYAAARNAIILTCEDPYPDHDVNTEEGFRAEFTDLVRAAFRPEFADDVLDRERTQGMISALFVNL